jgi:hypothetical protein
MYHQEWEFSFGGGSNSTMIDPDLLRLIRIELPMAVLIAALGRDGPPSKIREGRFVFLCPYCGERETAINPRNNLAHCFSYANNLNTIDLVRTLGYDFIGAITV